MTSLSHLRAATGAAVLSFVLASAASAQATFQMAPSGRATTVVEIAQRMPQGTPAAQRPAPRRVSVDYGQPHARGRDVTPLLTPAGTAWRVGANAATTLRSDVDLSVGGRIVPKGEYTLFVQKTATGAELIINKQTGQWGTVYDSKQDLLRVPMRVRVLSQPLDALQIALVPTANSLKGVLRVVWGTYEMEADWEATP